MLESAIENYSGSRGSSNTWRGWLCCKTSILKCHPLTLYMQRSWSEIERKNSTHLKKWKKKTLVNKNTHLKTRCWGVENCRFSFLILLISSWNLETKITMIKAISHYKRIIFFSPSLFWIIINWLLNAGSSLCSPFLPCTSAHPTLSSFLRSSQMFQTLLYQNLAQGFTTSTNLSLKIPTYVAP